MRTSALRVLALLMLPGLAGAASFLPLGYIQGGATFKSDARSVSADGSVVVGGVATGTDSEGPPEAFRWTSTGGMVSLGDLPGGVFDSRAFGVSADGAVVVGWGSIAPFGTFEAFRWTSGGGMVGLGDLPGGIFNSMAYAVSGDGSVVVGVGQSDAAFPPAPTTSEAFRWTSAGGMVGLGFLPGDNQSTAFGVSADGSVVVGRGVGPLGAQAFRWIDGVMIGLGDLPGGTLDSWARSVSADGSVVVGYGNSDVGTEAFVWTESSGMERLFDVLVTNGATGLTGWRLQFADSISADGRWIAGHGINPDGFSEAFLADLAPIPVPPAVWLFGSALGVMGWMRRKAAA